MLYSTKYKSPEICPLVGFIDHVNYFHYRGHIIQFHCIINDSFNSHCVIVAI